MVTKREEITEEEKAALLMRELGITPDELAPFEDGIGEATRRELGKFDGLLGALHKEAATPLRAIVSYLRDHLLNQYPEQRLRDLLDEWRPQPGAKWVTPVPVDVELAINVFEIIRSATRCDDERMEVLILGEGGVRDQKRQAGTRKERRPEITGWIMEQLRRDPHAKSPDLWKSAPEWITDQIGERRFAARVTACRKTLASK